LRPCICLSGYYTPWGRVKEGGFAEKLAKHPKVAAVFETTGNIDDIVKVYGRDIKDITDFVINYIRQIKGVVRTETVIALSERRN